MEESNIRRDVGWSPYIGYLNIQCLHYKLVSSPKFELTSELETTSKSSSSLSNRYVVCYAVLRERLSSIQEVTLECATKQDQTSQKPTRTRSVVVTTYYDLMSTSYHPWPLTTQCPAAITIINISYRRIPCPLIKERGVVRPSFKLPAKKLCQCDGKLDESIISFVTSKGCVAWNSRQTCFAGQICRRLPEVQIRPCESFTKIR